MASPPQPRWTDVETLGYHLGVSATDIPRTTLAELILASSEVGIERYCRRRFAAYPGLRSDYQRQVIECAGQGQTNVLQLAGMVGFGYLGSPKTYLPLPITAAQLQAALVAISGLASVTCAGGPLPSYPISVYMTGVPNATTQPQAPIEVDSTGISPAGWAQAIDAGFDSNPPKVLRFTTRGQTSNRVPDLRLVDAAPDPAVPGSGGVSLYGRRLFPNQYFLEYGGYAPGGADEISGSGPYAEPANEIILGYGYGLGMTLAQQFAYVLPQMYLANDLWITGRWGWSPTPIDIVEATYVVAARRYRAKDAAFSDTLITPEGLTLSFFRSLPADAQAVLDSYRIPNLALV